MPYEISVVECIQTVSQKFYAASLPCEKSDVSYLKVWISSDITNGKKSVKPLNCKIEK